MHCQLSLESDVGSNIGWVNIGSPSNNLNRSIECAP